MNMKKKVFFSFGSQTRYVKRSREIFRAAVDWRKKIASSSNMSKNNEPRLEKLNLSCGRVFRDEKKKVFERINFWRRNLHKKTFLLVKKLESGWLECWHLILQLKLLWKIRASSHTWSPKEAFEYVKTGVSCSKIASTEGNCRGVFSASLSTTPSISQIKLPLA